MKITFVTGNANKAKNVQQLLGVPVVNCKIDLPEIQSLDLQEVVEAKLKSAFDIVGGPVIVEDISLEFCALKRLPGPFVKFFVEEIGVEQMCRLLDGQSRKAIIRCILGYTDGMGTKYFAGETHGEIATDPRGSGGFGFDKIFIPNGFSGKTNSELSINDYEQFYTRLRPFNQLREYLSHFISEGQ